MNKLTMLSQKFSMVAVSLFLVWTGSMRFFELDISYYQSIEKIYGYSSNNWLAYLVGVLQILLGLLILMPIKSETLCRLLKLLCIFWLLPLTLLFTHPVWIESLGGFPAIGSGQGLIKYLAMSGVALSLSSALENNYKQSNIANYIMLSGLLLVLLWIGGMKFTLLEAQGIKPLIETSPFMSWLYLMFDLTETSVLIGVLEIITAALLLAYRFNALLFSMGALF